MRKFLYFFSKQQFCFMRLFVAIASVFRPLWIQRCSKEKGKAALQRHQSLSFSTCANGSRCYFALLTVGGRIWVLLSRFICERHGCSLDIYWRCSYVAVFSSCTFMHRLESPFPLPFPFESWQYILFLFKYKNSNKVQLKRTKLYYLVYRVLLVNDGSSAILSCEPVPV